MASILDSAERLLARAGGLLTLLEQCEVQAQQVISQVTASELSARTVIDATAQLESRLALLFDAHQSALRSAVATVAYAAETLGPDQVDAVASYLAAAPLLDQVERDVLPTLRSLRTLAPDLTELLAVSKALNEMMGSVPGLGRVKKRIDHELGQDDER